MTDKPADSERVYRLAERTIDQTDIADLIDWLKTDPWLTQGPLVRQFEQQWAKWMGSKYAVYCNSGSSANLLIYAALLYSDRLRNTRVVVPAVAWPTTVSPAIQLGFEPIMCDADPDTFGLDVDALEKIVREQQPATVVVVHVLGMPAKLDRLLELQKKYSFHLLEDSCAATGSTYNKRKVGSFGTFGTFSFFFGHHLSTMEGGMVVTDDEKLYDVLIRVRAHGWARDAAPEKEAAWAKERGIIEFNRPFTFYLPGFNLRGTDLQARLGLSQLRKADHVVARRAENHRAYQSRFLQSKDFRCQRNDKGETSSISFALLAASVEHRERIAAALREAHVETRPIGGGNMSRQPFWSDRFGAQVFPMADRVHQTGLQLPNHPGLSVQDVGHICDVVQGVRAA